jgi:hypothetical protein
MHLRRTLAGDEATAAAIPAGPRSASSRRAERACNPLRFGYSARPMSARQAVRIRRMQVPLKKVVAVIGLAFCVGPALGTAQNSRDFTFTEGEAHRIIRFVGTPDGGLTEEQRYEVTNSEFSTMVHDRIWADIRFEAEPRDAQADRSLAPRLEAYLRENGPEFDDIIGECRATTCRVTLEHDDWLTLGEHEALLDRVQPVIEALVAADAAHFEPAFMITAYAKEPHTPNLKVFLTRKSDAN